MSSSLLITKALNESIKDSKSVGSLSDSLLKYLEENHLTYLLPNIIRKLELESRKEEKSKKIQIFTSHEFDEKTIEKIKQLATSDIDKKGDEKFETKVDSSLIGGFVIKGKNKIVDASLKKNLQFLRESLIK